MRVKSNIINKNDGFLVQLLFLLFRFLEKISVFYWLRKVAISKHEAKGKIGKPFVMTYIFPELWAVGNCIFAITAIEIIKNTSTDWLMIVLLIYAIERIFEMLIYQINVLFFSSLTACYLEETDEEKYQRRQKEKKQAQYIKLMNENVVMAPQTGVQEEYAIKSATRTVILLIFNMLEYILQFTVIYTSAINLQQINEEFGILQSFAYFMSMGSLDGSGKNTWLMVVVYVETVIGIFMNILCLARFIGMLPDVKQKGYKKESENNAENRTVNDVQPEELRKLLFIRLHRLGKISEKTENEINKENDIKILSRWLHAAIKADDMKNFKKKM